MTAGCDDRADAAARIVDAAIELIGSEGTRAATVRRVAGTAGVSAPLVLHHFGSKEGLIEACDGRVLALVESLIAAMTDSGADGAIQHLLADDTASAALAYVGRSMHDDGEIGRTWFERLYSLTRAGLADMEATGVARRTDDPTMVSLLVLAMDLGIVLLRPHVERVLGASLTDRVTTERWVTAEFDLLSRSLLSPHTSPETT